MTTTNDVTEALQRTIGLMQGELERSVLSSQLLGNLRMCMFPGLTLTYSNRGFDCFPKVCINNTWCPRQPHDNLEAPYHRSGKVRLAWPTPHSGCSMLLYSSRLVHPQTTSRRPQSPDSTLVDKIHTLITKLDRRCDGERDNDRFVNGSECCGQHNNCPCLCDSFFGCPIFHSQPYTEFDIGVDFFWAVRDLDTLFRWSTPDRTGWERYWIYYININSQIAQRGSATTRRAIMWICLVFHFPCWFILTVFLFCV